MLDQLKTTLENPHFGRWATLTAAVLSLSSLSSHLVFDDYVLGNHVRGHDITGLSTGPFGDLFSFTSGRPEDNIELMSEGALLPWWSEPKHLNSFFRPLSSLTHRFDFEYLFNLPVAMHFHSWLWFIATLWAAHKLFVAVGGTRGHVSLALALFALDSSHGSTLSWLSNRNALVALCFSILAVSCHLRLTRADQTGAKRPWWLPWAGPGLFALGLLGGEAAIGGLGYLAASALTLETDSWPRRFSRLLPYGFVLVGWRVVYRIYGLGSFGSGGYHDPIREPISFVAGLVQNMPILLGSQLGFPYADQAFWGPGHLLTPLLILSAFILTLVLWLSWSLLSMSPRARFYLLGCALAAVPVSASIPGQRLLYGISFGASGFLALLLLHLCAAAKTNRGMAFAALALSALHIPAAAIALPLTSRSMSTLAEMVEYASADLPCDATTPNKTFVIVNAPFTVMASYEQSQRALNGRFRPAHLYWLATASSELAVTRQDSHSLLIAPEGGFLEALPDRHYRGSTAGLTPGAIVRLPRLSATVLNATADNRPASVLFQLDSPLESPDLVIFEYRDGRFQPWKLPGIGETTLFPKMDLFEMLAQHVVSHL